MKAQLERETRGRLVMYEDPLLQKYENRGSEKSTDLPEVTQQVSDTLDLCLQLGIPPATLC